MRPGSTQPPSRRTLQAAERYQLVSVRNVTRVTTDPSGSIPNSKEWEVGFMRSDQLQMLRYGAIHVYDTKSGAGMRAGYSIRVSGPSRKSC